MLVPALLLIALLLASSRWLVRSRSRPTQTIVLLTLIGALFVLPWLPATRESHIISRGLLTLASCAVLTPKLLDAHLVEAVWRSRGFREWLFYLLNPFVLVYRAHLEDPGGRISTNIRLVASGALRMASGVAILYFAFRHDFRGSSFWVEHSIKTLGAYLLCFDGQFVAATGLMRLVTGRSLEFSMNPILAHSPADFWRRYNRDAGRFLYMDLMLPLTGRRSPLKGIAIVFLANGMLHEFLAWVLSGRLFGYQMAFFALQSVATMLTFSWRPAGMWRVLSIGATFLFMMVTSALFFASIDSFVDWYDTENPLSWSW